MTAASDAFATNNGNFTTGIQVNAGGHLTAANTSFSSQPISRQQQRVE